MKLKLVRGDDKAYDCLIENKQPVLDSIVTINYNYFYDEISKMSKIEVEKLNKAIGMLNIVCISLEYQNGDDPQLIFESLNSTGFDLESADKIRNFVLMNMNSKR